MRNKSKPCKKPEEASGELVSYMIYSSTLKMEAICSSETSDFLIITRRYNLKEHIIHNNRSENLM
jgi:hypothetical protein